MYRVLVVDDDPMLRGLLGKSLGKAGFEVLEAATGKAALESMSNTASELVVTDVLMPDMNGLDVVRALRKQNPAIPMVIISGGGPTDVEKILAEASDMPSTLVLRKPFSNRSLVDTVQTLLAATSCSSENTEAG
jgi:CheY-like chemotaxis protein